MNNVATNQSYFNAFNEYMQTHNLSQAENDGYIRGDNQVYPVNFDMFFGFLVNKVVMSIINNNAFIDKLDKFYKDGYMRYGAIIEDKATILKSTNYDYDTKNFETDVENPFKKSKKGLMVVFHRNREHKKITLTISYEQLESGCLNENGIDALVNSMVNDIGVEYSAWAYDRKKQCLIKRTYAQLITFNDYADFNIKLKNAKIDMTNYENSWKHNASLLFRPTTEDNLAIVMSEKYKNEVDVNWFTGLFNVSYAELKDRITYIDEFPDKDIVCGLYDTRGFQFRKVLDKTTALPNGADLTENRWTHFWRVHSVSPLYSAIMFKKASAGVYEDESILVKGYDEENKSFLYDNTDSNVYEYTVPENITETDMVVEVNGVDEEDTVSAGDTIEITDKKQLAPVVIKFYKDNTKKDLLMVTRIRFEYPSNIDATLGHPMDIE